MRLGLFHVSMLVCIEDGIFFFIIVKFPLSWCIYSFLFFVSGCVCVLLLTLILLHIHIFFYHLILSLTFCEVFPFVHISVYRFVSTNHQIVLQFACICLYVAKKKFFIKKVWNVCCSSCCLRGSWWWWWWW